jgi:hypothetical protein
MGIARVGKTRQTMYLSAGEETMLKFAMKCSGLDKTSTIRFLMRKGVIELLFEWKRTGIPKLPEDLLRLVEGVL